LRLSAHLFIRYSLSTLGVLWYCNSTIASSSQKPFSVFGLVSIILGKDVEERVVIDLKLSDYTLQQNWDCRVSEIAEDKYLVPEKC
jgi:hypothetical protein